MIPQSQPATALQLDLVTMQVQTAAQEQIAELQELVAIYSARKAAGQAEVELNGNVAAE